MRRVALDALRGVAALLVVLSHANVPGFGRAGASGVTLFFVLSGYLITGVLVRGERLRVFYLRRAARLLPALLVMLVLVGVIQLAMGSGREFVRVAFLAAFYVSNYFPQGLGPLTHTWSLAVEEQFYLVWPVLIALTPRRRLPSVLLGIVILSVGLRVLLQPISPVLVMSGTATNAYALAAGALLAVSGSLPEAPRWLLPVGAASVAIGALAPPLNGRLDAVVNGGPLAAAGATLLVWSCAKRVSRAPRLLCHFGDVSYAWYLWHFPIIWLAASAGTPEWRVGVLASLVALGLAELSTRFVERPIRTLVRRETEAGSRRPTRTVLIRFVRSPEGPDSARTLP